MIWRTLAMQSNDETDQQSGPQFDRIRRALGELEVAKDNEARWAALEQFYPDLYGLAKAGVARDSPEATLRATAVVHEVLVKLLLNKEWRCETASEFRAFASVVIRNLLTTHARRRRLAREHRHSRRELDEHVDRLEAGVHGDLDALARALQKLREFDRVGADLVDMKFFLEYTMQEAADALGQSPSTVERKWRLVRAWLSQEVKRDA